MIFLYMKLSGGKPVTINLDRVCYMVQNQKGEAVIVMDNGMDLIMDDEYGNVQAYIQGELQGERRYGK